jgi:hypothetical protein
MPEHKDTDKAEDQKRDITKTTEYRRFHKLLKEGRQSAADAGKHYQVLDSLIQDQFSLNGRVVGTNPLKSGVAEVQ